MDKFESSAQPAGVTAENVPESDIDARVRAFTIPSEFMVAAKMHNARITMVQKDLAKWNEVMTDWKMLENSNPLYTAAQRMLEADMTQNEQEREEKINEARVLVRRHLEGDDRFKEGLENEEEELVRLKKLWLERIGSGQVEERFKLFGDWANYKKELSKTFGQDGVQATKLGNILGMSTADAVVQAPHYDLKGGLLQKFIEQKPKA